MKSGKLTEDNHIGTVIEDDLIALDQLCRICGTNSEWVFSLVHESVIEPEPFETELPGLRFSGKSLARARSAMRLQRDLGVNLEGIALVLDLMEEINELRAQLSINNKTG
jgi:chaperone modulatory protein CbpM